MHQDLRALYSGDNLSQEQRRRTMQAVKSRNTRPEIALRKALARTGVRGYRLDWRAEPGRPDIAFPGRRIAVFVDGAFWHGRADRLRPGRSQYWDRKIARNRARDLSTDRALRTKGWRVLRVWDDDVLKDDEGSAMRVRAFLSPKRIGEFFAGIGLVGLALEELGQVVYANDIDPWKLRLYRSNLDASTFALSDIRDVEGSHIPDLDLATASFPCTDLSLAGSRAGLSGDQSGMFWEFARILEGMGRRRPYAVMLENVPSFATSHGGEDLRSALARLNQLGYWCDLLVLDARHFVPQSRPRLFIVGAKEHLTKTSGWAPSVLRPAWIQQFVSKHPELKLNALALPMPPRRTETLADMVERLPDTDERWWDQDRQLRFLTSLSGMQRRRLEHLRSGFEPTWATAYRRTRDGTAVWEIRGDEISGCLRTSRGGSSRQAVVETACGTVRIRWMTAREYARLQGAPNYFIEEDVSESKAQFGFGDAVCVPAVAWLAKVYLRPLLDRELTGKRRCEVLRA